MWLILRMRPLDAMEVVPGDARVIERDEERFPMVLVVIGHEHGDLPVRLVVVRVYGEPGGPVPTVKPGDPRPVEKLLRFQNARRDPNYRSRAR